MTLSNLVSDGLLAFDRFGVVGGGGVFGDDGIVGVEGFEELALAFEDFGVAIGCVAGVWRERVSDVDGPEVSGGAADFSSGLGGLSIVVISLRGAFASAGGAGKLRGVRIAAAGG